MAEFTEIQVDGVPMRIAHSAPAGAGPHPAVVVMFHRGGFDDFTLKFVDGLAEQGFVAASMDLYHWPPVVEPPEKNDFPRDPEITKDVEATIAWLGGRGDVQMDKIAIAGHCMGGRMAFWGASTCDKISACIAYYPGNMFKPWSDDGPPPFEVLENIKGPVIGFFGGDDQNPSPDDMAKLDAELSRLGITHDFHAYPGAGHAFQNFLSDERYREKATKDSLSKMASFLDKWRNG